LQQQVIKELNIFIISHIM